MQGNCMTNGRISAMSPSFEKELNIDKQVKEANYVQLVQYLREHDINIGTDLFKAVLFAMNGMTLYNQTKPVAIKRSSEFFKVTQVSVKEHIDALGIVSQRAKDNSNLYKQQWGRLNAITSKQLKGRIEREC